MDESSTPPEDACLAMSCMYSSVHTAEPPSTCGHRAIDRGARGARQHAAKAVHTLHVIGFWHLALRPGDVHAVGAFAHADVAAYARFGIAPHLVTRQYVIDHSSRASSLRGSTPVS